MQKNGKPGTIGTLLKPRREKAAPAQHPDLSYVGLEHVEAHTSKLLGSVPATEMRSTANRFYSGDVLYSRLRPYLNKVWRADRDGLCSSEFIVLPGNDEIDANFLRYRLNSADFVSFANSLNAGDRPRVDFDQISSFCLPNLSLDVQCATVAEIEKQFTRLEAGVAALRRVQANLKRYRAAVLKAACEGKLVPTEAELQKSAGKGQKGFESGEQLLKRILAERRQWFDRQQAGAKTKKKYVEPSQPETIGLPPLPDGWIWGTWNQLSNWVTYGFTRPMPHVDEGIPIVTAKSVNKSRIDYDGAHLTTCDAYGRLSEKDRPEAGDILITKDGTIGRAAVVDTDREFCINQSVAVIWLRSCPMERKFLLTVIESELTQKPIWAKARGVAIQHLSITDFARMALPIPPLAEQTRIVAEVERRLSVVEELELLVSTNLQRAIRLRMAVLQGAFNSGCNWSFLWTTNEQ